MALTKHMKYQKLIKAWLEHKEWTDEATHDEETNQSVVSFSVGINNQSFSTYLEGDGKKDWLSLGSPGFLVAKIQGEQAGWEDETKQGRDGGGALWEAAGP